MKKKLFRREKKLSELLKEVTQLKMLTADESETLSESFQPETMTLIQNEMQAQKVAKNRMRYSEELKSFAVSLHFYSAQAYEYARKHLHLPRADIIRRCC